VDRQRKRRTARFDPPSLTIHRCLNAKSDSPVRLEGTAGPLESALITGCSSKVKMVEVMRAYLNTLPR